MIFNNNIKIFYKSNKIINKKKILLMEKTKIKNKIKEIEEIYLLKIMDLNMDRI